MAGPSRVTQLPPLGMPILSGSPPVVESDNCRKCGKSFNVLFRRPHPCGHCGYAYCSDCMSDGQALMPRKSGDKPLSSGGFLAELKDAVGIDDRPKYGNGYEVERVCLHCLGMLQVTAAPLEILRSMPIKRLKEYLAAYDIPCIGPKEKEDFVQAALKARNPVTGCLPPEQESFYRRKSVPNGAAPAGSKPSSANFQGSRSLPNQQRPMPQPAPRPMPQSAPRPMPQSTYRPAPSYQPAGPPGWTPNGSASSPPPAQRTTQPTQQWPGTNGTAAPKPAPARPAAAAPPPPVPSIMSLVALPTSYLSSLSIGTLKAILYENHVKVDFKQVLEKQELINRVSELITAERKRLERQRIEEEREAAGAQADSSTNDTFAPAENGEGSNTAEAKPSVVPTGPMPDIERGLCVVCQDEEATLAVVDCGHLCMCAHCSDLIMATSRECPLCRTRIVTEQRLIRIFKV